MLWKTAGRRLLGNKHPAVLVAHIRAEKQVFKEKLSFLPEHKATHAAFPRETKLLHCLGKNRSSLVQAKELHRAVWSRKQLLLPCGVLETRGRDRDRGCKSWVRSAIDIQHFPLAAVQDTTSRIILLGFGLPCEFPVGFSW